MTEHHDEAEAYRNRAERAEQEAAELRATVKRLKAAFERAGTEMELIRHTIGLQAVISSQATPHT